MPWDVIDRQCAVAENIHTRPEKDHWKFRGRSQKTIFLKESMKQNWNFQRG